MLAQTYYVILEAFRSTPLKYLGDMVGKMTGPTEHELNDTHEWLRRAHVNAKTARLIVEQDDQELRIEAVTQVQQACEKATKAVMLASGATYADAKAMGHNTIGAYANLIVQMATVNPLAQINLSRLVTKKSMDTVTALAEVALGGRRHKSKKRKVLAAWKRVLPESSQDLGNTALEEEEWRHLTKSFSREVVNVLVDLHHMHVTKWSEYIDKVPSRNVELRPLFGQTINPEVWLQSPDFAGFPSPPGRNSSATSLTLNFDDVARGIVSTHLTYVVSNVDRRDWPQTVDVKGIASQLGKWVQALLWLLLCATVTTPHAVSSRYPAEVRKRGAAKGSQDYTDRLGVMACIAALATITEEVIGDLIEHYRQVESGFTSFAR